MDRPAFGALLRELRLRARLSQEALAERARISVQAVSALERGARRAPQRQTLGLLIDGLGLDPAGRTELEAAAAASVQPRVRAGGQASAAALAAPAAAADMVAALPVVPTSFVGRERELAELAALLRPGRCVTVWGSGGIGKTRLVLETARASAERFPAGVWFVELAPLADGADVARAAAAAAGVREQADRSIGESLAAALAGKHGLLVLDNAEHVLAGCAALVELLLRGAPALAIACTSREPLRAQGERVYPLDPLPVPELGDRALRDAPAVRLFLDRAESAGVRIDPRAGELGAAELGAVATICRRLDAIPLALELAAARTPLMSAARIAEALDDRFRLLTRGGRTTSARHQTLVGTLDWSFALVSETERVVLRRLAVWPGSWTLDDATAVAGGHDADRWTVIDAVGDLVDRSLVVASAANGGERRFRLLQTTRAYAFARLEEAGERHERERLQAERVRDAAAAASDAWRGGDEGPFRALEADAVRTALRWSITLRNDPVLGAVVAGRIAMFWDFQAMQIEGLRWIDDALAALNGESDSNDAATAYALIGRARLARRLHLHRQAYDAAERAAALAERAGDVALRAQALGQMGDPAAALGRYDEGRLRLEEAAALFERLGDWRGRLGALWEHAFVAVRSGRYDEARGRLTELVTLFRSRGEHWPATQAAINLAEAEFGSGDTRAAIARGRDALSAARALGASLLIAAALQNLAGYLLATDDAHGTAHEPAGVDAAARFARESLALAVENGYGAHASFAIGHLADVLARRGKLREGALLTGYADRRLREAGVEREAPEQRAYDALRARFSHAVERSELDGDELDRALRDGASLDDDAAVRLALDLTAE